MRPSFELQRRRDEEFARAETKADVDRLMAKWQAEDDVAARAADWRTKQLHDLTARVAQLERAFGSIEDVMAEVLADERQETADAIVKGVARAMTTARMMHYRGTWRADERYGAGACVTAKGALWVAMEQAEPGEKPGDGGPWKLAVKSQRDKEPTFA